MLRLIPPALHRRLFRLAHALRRCWWRIRKPRLHGCRVLAFDAQGRVLLIRHSYGSGKWMPPGGGIGRSESPITAALRELHEETGCGLQDAMEIAEVEERLHGAGNRVHVIAGETRDAPRPDGREIIEARFFAPDALPVEMPAHLMTDLTEWIKAAKAARR